jgi:hypothetical protein
MRRIAFLFLALPLTAHAAVDFTGTWSGTLTGQKLCRNSGLVVAQRGDITAYFTQTGDAVAGSIVISVPSLNDQCQQIGAISIVVPVGGAVSGATLSSPVEILGTPAQFNAAIANGSMTATLKIPNERTDLAGVLTRTSSQPPASELSGKYTGTFTATILPCKKPPAVTFSGTLSLSLLQAGATIAGSGLVSGSKSDQQDPTGQCTLVDEPPANEQLSARISGTTIGGFITEDDGTTSTFVGTVGGNTITGSLTNQNPGESLSFTLTRMSVGTPVAISRFIAGPATIAVGEPSTLAWETIGAASVSIDNGIGAAKLSGRASVSPQQTTTYTLTAAGPGGSATATTTVIVTGTGPRVGVGKRAVGMLAEPGSTATDGFTVVNAGTAPANITLSLTGNFFTATPLSFTLPAKQNQRVAIAASAQQSGVYDGSITANGDGVPQGGFTLPVRLRVVAPPSGTVNPRADAARVAVSAPGGQNPTGTASFTNRGSATVEAIAVSDVPWIIPQKDPITIAPGQSQKVAFTIDRSQRPDAGSPIGGVAGKLSLVFLAFGAGKGTVAGTTTSQSSRVSVSVLDTSTPAVAPGPPPPLAFGEVAFFIDNLPSVLGSSTGDLFLSNLGAASISDLKLYQIGGSQASLPPLPPNIAAAFPSLAKSVFGVETAQTFQVRTSNATDMSVGNLKTQITGGLSYATAVPVLRSDRGANSGEQLVLSGIEKSASNTSEIFLQELTGTAATAQVQFLDSSGAALGSPQSQSLAAFGSVSISDAVPANARAAIITNNSSGFGRISAFARVVNGGSSDGWMVTDSAKLADTPSDTFIVPLFPIPSVTTTAVNLFATNTSASAVSMTMDQVSVTTGRRRAVAAATSPGNTESSLTLQPSATADIPITGLVAGYVRVNAPGDAVHVSGRETAAVTEGSGQMGSGLPAIPVTAALAAGESVRFTGVDDSSDAEAAAGTTGTYRSNLMLIEAFGDSAQVRVTIRFTFSAGTSTIAEATSFHDFNLTAGQATLISNLARAVIGSQRDALGDLRNMQVDVTVVDGGGRVIPVIEFIDNGSGDIVVRTE